MVFDTHDKEIRLIGEGGNSHIYLLDREYAGRTSAIIKVPKAFVDINVNKALENYDMLKQHGITTTAFLDECSLDGRRALITENLHHDDYTYLDSNAHLRTPVDFLLRQIDKDYEARHDEKEPEEERWFADHKFERITNLKEFANNHLVFLEKVSAANIYLAYDCYYFKVKKAKVTDLDYIIADWDDVQICDQTDLYELNKGEFVSALRQFVQKYVSEDVSDEYNVLLDNM